MVTDRLLTVVWKSVRIGLCTYSARGLLETATGSYKYYDNEKFTYGDEQHTSTKAGKSESSERPDRRLKTTFSIASKHFHGIPPGRRTSKNPRIYVSAMQVANLAHVPEIDATVTMSPGMLAYVKGNPKDKGWCIIQNITAYNNGPQR